MAYNLELAERVRKFLHALPQLKIEEKKMFRGLAFLVNGKMCVNVSGDDLMCRFDPAQETELAVKPGFKPMEMNGRIYKGYCYVGKEGYTKKTDFDYWLKLCLAFNEKAKSSKKKKAG